MEIADNLFLIGPMGVGKTTIGKHLAELLHKEFHDVDQELEKGTGASIAIIFEIEGEDGFRKRETKLINELATKPNIVMATGGGAVLSPKNRKVLRTRGFVVYLHADIDTLVKRTRRDHSRPLLHNGDKRKKIEALMAQREPLYREQADLIIKTDESTCASRVVGN